MKTYLDAFTAAKAAAVTATADVERIAAVVADLHRELDAQRAQAHLAAEVAGQALVASRLDGSKTRPQNDSGVLAAMADERRLESAVAAAETRLRAAQAASGAAKVAVDAAREQVRAAEADAAAEAVLRSWPSYRAAWIKYAVASDAAGRYVSDLSEDIALPNGGSVTVQPCFAGIERNDLAVARAALVGPTLR